MIFHETPIIGTYIIDLEKHQDHRGYFARSWCEREFYENGLNPTIAQINIGYSNKAGTIRGLHYQVEPFQEAKTVKCVKGSIFDVVVDLRRDSPTYRRWYGMLLEPQDGRMLHVPEGCAHGYQTLEDDTEILYMVSQFYSPEAEKGIRFDDPAFNINWPVKDGITISEKDLSSPDFEASEKMRR